MTFNKKLKILPLDTWMKYTAHRAFPELKKALPYIGRDGFYKRFDISWFEINNVAYIMEDCMSFDSTLELLNIPPSIRQCEIDAMVELRKAGLLCKSLSKLLSNIELRKELRTITLKCKQTRLK